VEVINASGGFENAKKIWRKLTVCCQKNAFEFEEAAGMMKTGIEILANRRELSKKRMARLPVPEFMCMSRALARRFVGRSGHQVNQG
jgi:hypothetical protein